MKKHLIILLVLAFVFSILLVGCNSQSTNQATTNQGSDKSETGNSNQTNSNKVDFPTQSITYSIPFDPGGQSDIEARRQQPYLEKILGQRIIVTYKPGGGGAVGWTELVSKKPDGHFISGINIPHIVLQPLSQEGVGYQTEQITPVAIFQATPVGLAVSKDSDIKSLDDLIAKAKEKPGSITIAGSGTYSGHHLTHMLLQQKADIKLQYVPFTGAATSIQGFLGSNTEAIWGNSSDLLAYKDEMTIIVIGSENRFASLPDVPTFIELGIDMTAGIDRGVGVPQGTDPEIVKILEAAFLEIANDPDVIKQMNEEGFEPKAMGAEESRQYIENVVSEYKPLIEQLKESEK